MITLNGHIVKPTLFPDNTSQIWQIPDAAFDTQKIHKIVWKFESEAELIHLAQLSDLLDMYSFKYANLEITYLPYGRQDKGISNNTTFGLRTFAKLLNAMDFHHVTIHDPHSIIATELINNSEAVYPVQQVLEIAKLTDTYHLCYPDKGALTKYAPLYDLAASWGEKVRDQYTGNITSYKLVGFCEGRNILIVDDICDGGMTFKLLAKELLNAGAKEVNLFVSHGIFSKGLKTLHDSGIKRVFTTDGEVFEHQNNITYRKV